MRYSREHKQETHARIVRKAAIDSKHPSGLLLPDIKAPRAVLTRLHGSYA